MVKLNRIDYRGVTHVMSVLRGDRVQLVQAEASRAKKVSQKSPTVSAQGPRTTLRDVSRKGKDLANSHIQPKIRLPQVLAMQIPNTRSEHHRPRFVHKPLGPLRVGQFLPTRLDHP
jgi:hypothetical protein